MQRRPAIAFAALALTMLAGCGDLDEPVRTVADEHALSELRPVRAVLDTTTTTLPPSTTTTHPPSTTSTAPPPTTTTSTTLSTQPPPPTGEGCAGWADTIAAHFPPEQRAKACSVLLCESHGNPTAENPSSSASGLWQFLDSTWRTWSGLAPPAAAYSGDVQTAAAAGLWRSSGWSPWSCA